jgi:hypothetical protein
MVLCCGTARSQEDTEDRDAVGKCDGHGACRRTWMPPGPLPVMLKLPIWNAGGESLVITANDGVLLLTQAVQ